MTTLKEKVFNRITDDFHVLTQLVNRQLHLIDQLLQLGGKEETFAEINHNERLIDSMEVKIRDEIINTIVLYTPKATNLRMIIAYYDMTAYLERIGDLLLNISHFLKKTNLQGTFFREYQNLLAKMRHLAENMAQNAIFAFTYEDIRLAQETIELDDRMDALHHQVGNLLPQHCTDHPLTVEDMTDALSINSISYNLERVGDNATNIAEAAIYLIEGKNIKHWEHPQDNLPATGNEG